MSNFSKQLEDSGISKSELASRLGVDKAQVTRWTKWGMPIPSGRISAVSKATGIPEADLLPPFISQDGTKIARVRAQEDAS